MRTKKSLSLMAMSLGASLLCSAAQPVMAGDADMGRRGVEGSVSCGGNHFNRNGGTETQRSNYVLRNFSDDGTIYLNRVRVYNAGGTLVYDSAVSGMPPFVNNVLSNADNTLNARQSAQLNLADFIPAQNGSNRPLQTVFDWSADEPTLAMEVSHIRTVSEYDAATGATGKQYARGHTSCRTTNLKPFYYNR
jgi:hypothetical protein